MEARSQPIEERVPRVGKARNAGIRRTEQDSFLVHFILSLSPHLYLASIHPVFRKKGINLRQEKVMVRI